MAIKIPQGLINVARPTHIDINSTALLHNLNQVRQYASRQKIIAMVKADAYGCGLASVLPVLEGRVDAFGVSCIEEAKALRALGSRSPCVLFQGVYHQDELEFLTSLHVECVVHQALQLKWILNTPMTKKIKVWVKVNTGMQRLGFLPEEVSQVVEALFYPWKGDRLQ